MTSSLVAGSAAPGAMRRDERSRPRAAGKFLDAGGQKVYIKGVTYGTFRPDGRGEEFHDERRVARDFELMARHGINAVRTYTSPPRWLLDLAADHDLLVLAGMPWEQHVTFLDEPRRARSIERRVRERARALADHPALLAHTIGNEIPAPIVRWHGRGRVERFLKRLYWAAKEADPGGLVTYVNYPSTEYLELPFLDLYAFNVYLEDRPNLERYLARLQNLAGDRPLLLAEIGLDSRRNGLDAQRASLDWQVRTSFAAAAAGTFVFAWTDEWHRGGHDIDDWDFGLTDRERRPKPALAAISRAYSEVPFPERRWPRVSVVVCSYNGARTIGQTCEGLLRLDYPDVEVIVVDDGSHDGTAAIAEEAGFRVIRTENRGLSAARNTGLAAASGRYVAYLDDDAWPDPRWLKYAVHTLESGGFAATGGPNVPPLDEPPTAQCVARSPGGPIHVLFDDVRAEHVPGCNLVVERSVLDGLGGFDARFHVAGDDVDLCWRILEGGHRIGFSPGAMVWHRRRDSSRGYLRQQRGYGRAEALLERKWPEKYNSGGHLAWAGTIYGPGRRPVAAGRWRVYYGRWGTGLFQRLYQPTPGVVRSLPLTPEWWLILGALAAVSVLSLLWRPLAVVGAAFLAALALTLGDALVSSRRGWIGERPPLRARALTAWLNLLQPVARLVGRLGYGLRPWSTRAPAGTVAPVARTISVWSESWRSGEEWVGPVRERLVARGAPPASGGDFDRWDLSVRGGLFGGARVRHTVEEHGAGRQLARFRLVPRLTGLGIALPLMVLIPAVVALLDGAWAGAAALGAAVVGLLLLGVRDASVGTALALDAIAEASVEGEGVVLPARPSAPAPAGSRGTQAAPELETTAP